MDQYRHLYHFLELPKVAADIAFRNIRLPLYSESPFDTYGFVPALLPLWSGEIPGYVGYWKHWFGSRKITLVEVTVENKRFTQEAARDFDQLTCEVALSAIENADGLTPEIRMFGDQAGIQADELDQIAQIQQEWGNEKMGLLSLPRFASAPPLACLASEEDYLLYTGDFPHDAMRLSEEILRNMCTTEISRELHAHISALPAAPPWFTAADQAPIFNDLVRQKDYLGAWMSLNSNGWRFLEAKEALRQLAQDSNLSGLDLLAEAWSAVPHEKNGLAPENASY